VAAMPPCYPTAWDPSWTGGMRMIRRRCLPVLRCARRAFGLSARLVHVDTTSFAVTGEYAPDAGCPHARRDGWVFPRPPRRPEAMDAGVGDDPPG
jgi:hypothetical protein